MSKSEALPVHIYFVLDRSGSMSSIANDVIGGFNAFVAEQKAQPGKCRLTLVQFDSQHPHEIIHDAVKIADVPDLTRETFIPRGGTPLLDAEGRTIAMAQTREAERKLSEKPAEAVLFVTYTDGEENSSTEWTREKLVAAKKAVEDTGWAFSYLGVGHDGYAQARSVGTHANSVMSAPASSRGVATTYAGASYSTNNVRSAAMRGRRVKSANLMDGFDKTSGTPEDNAAAQAVFDAVAKKVEEAKATS